MSGSLDIPVAALEPYRQRRIIVVTGKHADAEKTGRLLENGIEVVYAGSGKMVEGRHMIAELAARNYKSIYAIAGPDVFYTLLKANVLDRLYLTIACQLLGGKIFDSLTHGPLLEPARGMQLVSLFHDAHAPVSAGQMFGIFEPAT
jgi:riboflavin biosynthesis pyrimidine reductase